MDIGPVNRISDISAPVSSSTTTHEDPSMVREIVTAVRGLNKSELMGKDRELAFQRDPDSQHIVIRIMNRETGEIVDQIPPETVLRLMAEMRAKQLKESE